MIWAFARQEHETRGKRKTHVLVFDKCALEYVPPPREERKETMRPTCKIRPISTSVRLPRARATRTRTASQEEALRSPAVFASSVTNDRIMHASAPRARVVLLRKMVARCRRTICRLGAKKRKSGDPPLGQDPSKRSAWKPDLTPDTVSILLVNTIKMAVLAIR
jgi:hypothetical protein